MRRNSYDYSAGGTRAQKQGSGGISTYYAGSLYERDANSAGGVLQERMRIYAGGEPIAELRASGEELYLHSDVLGSVETISDGAGQLMQHRAYDPFGAVAPAIGPNDVKLGFTGHEHDTELGLINMKGRIQDPKLGRFLQADPIVASPLGQHVSAYSYALNSPTNLVDPTGLMSERENSTLNGRGGGPELMYGLGATGLIGAGVAIAQTEAGASIGSAFSSGASDLAGAAGNVATSAGLGVGLAFYDFATSGQLAVRGLTTNISTTRTNPVNGAGVPTRASTGGNDWAPVTEQDFRLLLRERGSLAGGGRAGPGSPRGGLGSLNGPPLLDFDPERYAYVLNKEGRRLLAPYFRRHFDFDVTRVSFAFRDQGPGGITVGNSIFLRKSDWSARTLYSQLDLLAHEIAHSVQYRQLGFGGFLSRYYERGFFRAENYGTPAEIWQIGPMSNRNIVHPDFTLDQLADRVGMEVAAQVPYP